MSEKGRVGRTSRDLVAMGFDEIARREGVTRGGAFMAFQSGMLKLRRKGVKLAPARAMANELERGRPVSYGEDER